MQHSKKKSDRQKASNHKLVANDFNSYFINVAENLRKDLRDKSNQFQDYLKNAYERRFFLKETGPQEVFKILRQPNAKKATAVYRISSKFIKTAANVLKNYLTILINHSINQGILPDKLKTGLTHPIHKGDSKSVRSNYRLISILPLFSKVFEKYMYIRLFDFVEINDLLYKKQFGFQR